MMIVRKVRKDDISLTVTLKTDTGKDPRIGEKVSEIGDRDDST